MYENSTAASMERKPLENADTVDTLKTYDLNQLWWVESWVNECKKMLEKTDTNGNKQKLLRTYKDWAFKNKVKAQAGMEYFKNAPSVSASPAAARGADSD